MLKVLVLLECHWSAHLGGKDHLGARGDLAGEGAHHDLGGGGGGGAAGGRARTASATTAFL